MFLVLGLVAGRVFFESMRGVPNQARQRHLIQVRQEGGDVTRVFLGMSPFYYGIDAERFDAGMRAGGKPSKSLILALGGAAAFELQEILEKVLEAGLPKLRTVYISDILMTHHLRRRSLNKNESINFRGLELYLNQLSQEPWSWEWLLAWKDLSETIFFRATNWGVAHYNWIGPGFEAHSVYPQKTDGLPWGACDDYQDWIQPMSEDWPRLAEPLKKLALSHGAQVVILHAPFRTPGSCVGMPNCLQPLSPEAERELLSEQYWWDCDHLNVKGSTIYTDALVKAVLDEELRVGERVLSSD